MLRIPFAEAREWMKYPWILLKAEEDQIHLSRLLAEVKIDGPGQYVNGCLMIKREIRLPK